MKEILFDWINKGIGVMPKSIIDQFGLIDPQSFTSSNVGRYIMYNTNTKYRYIYDVKANLLYETGYYYESIYKFNDDTKVWESIYGKMANPRISSYKNPYCKFGDIKDYVNCVNFFKHMGIYLWVTDVNKHERRFEKDRMVTKGGIMLW